MASILRLVKERFANRPDSEHGQAIVRLVIACLIVVYLLGLQGFERDSHATQTMLWVMLGESVVGLGLTAAIVWRQGVSHLRRWIGMIADYSTLAALMSLRRAVAGAAVRDRCCG